VKYIAVIIWMSSPVSKPTVTALSGERSMAECLAMVERAYNGTSVTVISGGCMTQQALDRLRTML
jgi:hypothetical protein